MTDIGIVLGLASMLMGTAVIAVLFFGEEKVLPRYRSANHQNSLAALLFLVSVSALVLDRVFGIGGAADYISVVSSFTGVAILIHLARAEVRGAGRPATG